MEFSASQIALIINGSIEGNPNATVRSFSKIEEAVDGQLAFLANPKYEDYLYSTGASIIIINQSLELREPVKAALIRVPDAYSAFATLLQAYEKIMEQKMVGIQEPSFVAKSAIIEESVFVGAFTYIGENVKLGKNVKVHPHCFLGNNVVIGDNSILHAGVKIYHDCVVGQKVIIHAGTVLGGDGFGFAPQEDGTYTKVPQIGNVIIEDNVEIGACTTIDRATLGSTIIKKGVKLDNHIQVAHNVEIGENTVIAAQTGIAGTTKIGKNCLIGGQVGFAGHLTIGDGVKIQAQSGIGKNLEAGEVVQGSPAFNYGDFAKSYVHFRNFPKIVNDLEELKSKIE